MEKVAFITGITGQDGSYLAELLLNKKYFVHGLIRRSSTLKRERIDHLRDKGLCLHYGDLTDSSSIGRVIKETRPDEVYNLAAQSHVGISSYSPENTADVNAIGTLRILETIKNLCPNAKFYQASSSEMFGKVEESPQNEKTKFHPRSPYACSKVFSHHLTAHYREAYNFHASCGILFNHESERRGENFVTRKITLSLARIKQGLQDKLSLGNLNSERDWGYAKDYVKAMWLMLQQDKPDDYVIGTGKKRKIRSFLEQVADYMNIKIKSNGEKGIREKYLSTSGKVIVDIDEKFFRPSEVDTLLADYSKAKKILGWEPETSLINLVEIMSDYDLEIAKKESYLINQK